MFTNTPLLIFNAVVFLNESNHRKMCQKKRETWSQTYAWVSVSKKQKCPNVIAYKLTHMLTHVLTHALKFGSQCKPGNTVVLKGKH